MNRCAKAFLVVGTLAALLGVLLGAFGAHALRARLASDMLATWKTAVDYQFYHAFGLLVVGLLQLHRPDSRLLQGAGWAMAAGVLLFSGSLYALALTGAAWLGVITPIGGVAFVLAWCLLLAALLRSD